MGNFFFLRMEDKGSYLNLLYKSPSYHGSQETNEALRSLMAMFADPKGYISYMDAEEFCIVTRRSSEFSELRIYEYDNEAPYEGYYLDGRFIEGLIEGRR